MPKLDILNAKILGNHRKGESIDLCYIPSPRVGLLVKRLDRFRVIQTMNIFQPD